MVVDPVMHGLMRGIMQEYQLRYVAKISHDALNLGKEVKDSTLTLLDFINKVASPGHRMTGA